MRKILIVSMLFANVISYSQDIIYKTNGDSVKCKITLVNDKNIFYEHKIKKQIEGETISLENVSAYVKNGIKTKTINNKSSQTTEKQGETAGDDLIQASKIINTSVGIIAAGVIITAIGLLSSPAIVPAAIVGSLITFAGGLHSLSAWGRIRKAGIILNRQKI